MIETFTVTLPTGIELHCRAIGDADAPLLLFLHGFPEGAFIWDPVMRALAPRYRCVAPDLRGYGESSAPADVDAYRVQALAGDMDALAQYLRVPLAALVAHDWGGALAWALGARSPAWLQRLVIINSPHPATFLRELQHSAAQRQASAYMSFLCRPDAEELLAANDFERMWPFFTAMGASDGSQPGGGWLTEQVRDDYRQQWKRGLHGSLNYYRASPIRPPTADDQRVMTLQLPPEMTRVSVPTLVLWPKPIPPCHLPCSTDWRVMCPTCAWSAYRRPRIGSSMSNRSGWWPR